MSTTPPFAATSAEAARLWERWVHVARSHAHREQMPSPWELQTICRESGYTLAEIEVFAAARNPPPLLLLCGGDGALAAALAQRMGYAWEPADVPDASVVWTVTGNNTPKLRLRQGRVDQSLSRKNLDTLLSGPLPPDEIIIIDETTSAPATWRFAWMPHPRFLLRDDSLAPVIELLWSQRAAVVISDHPDECVTLLKATGQKLWVVQTADTAAGDRERLVADVTTVLKDRPSDLDVRASAAWLWLRGQALERIDRDRTRSRKMLSHIEIKQHATQHLLTQYRKNWTGGIRTISESYFTNRTGSEGIADLLDPKLAGPTAETFLAAMNLPRLWSKLDEYLTDRMADFLAGLGGLAAKLELRRITLGDADARWGIRALTPKLEAALREQQVFPKTSGKRSGLVGNLTGKKQAISDERKGQIARATRVLSHTIESEFTRWCGALMASVEAGISLQLAAAAANQGLPDTDGLRTMLTGLDRLEAALRGDHAHEPSAEAVAVEWLRQLAARRWVPLYRRA